MKILANVILVSVAVTVGLAVGYAFRGGKSGIAEKLADVTESRGTQGLALRRQAKATAPDDSPLTTQLARDLSMSAGVTKWLHWMDAIDRAALADFPRLARLAASDVNALRLVAARWIDVNPRHLFDYLCVGGSSGTTYSELSRALFEEWPKRDLEGVIAAMNSTNALRSARQWRMQVANTAFDKDVERGLQLFSEWSIENYGPRMSAVTKWAAADPRHAAEFALKHPAGYASEMVMETIGKEWAKSDPAAAMAFASTQSGSLASKLGETALKEWASRDFDAAAKWLGEADPQAQRRLSAPFVEAWAKTDAAAALAWSQQNLTGSSLAKAVGGLFKGAASRNLAAAADLALGMEPSMARAEAVVAVAEKWMPQYGSDKPMPPEFLEWLRKMDAGSTRKAIERIVWQWSGSDPKGMADFLSTLSQDHVPDYAYNSLVRNMARNTPTEALAWANELPEERRMSVSADAFSEWQRYQPDAALKWLGELPPTDKRREPFLQSAISTMAHAPGGVEQIATLSAADRAAAQRLLGTMTLPEERRARLAEALGR